MFMRVVPLFLLALVVAGCGSKSEYASSADAATMPASAPMPETKSAMSADASAGGFQSGTERLRFNSPSEQAGRPANAHLASMPATPAPRMIVKNADLTVRVSKISEAEKSVGQIAVVLGGAVEATQSADLAGPSPSMSITIRVPVTRFDDTLTRLEALGTRLSKSITTEDVTTQAVDMDARLKSLRVQEDAYRAILGGARKIPDVLDVQERLTGVRTEIEQIVAQRRDLGDHAARSRVVVNLTQAVTPLSAAPAPADWASQTWGDATGSLRAFGRSLASFGMWLAAFVPVWLPVGLVVLFAFRRTRKGFVA
jgi:hypothetical protein